MGKKKLHPLIAGENFSGLFNVKSDTGLESFIGSKVKYKQWDKSMGTIARDEVYVIGSIQKIYTGELAFRVYATSYNDDFGRPMRVSESVIIND